ncbi:hypothetical protein Tco_0052830 [Tanacetum coccineum]
MHAESLRVYVNMWQAIGINHFCMRIAPSKRCKKLSGSPFHHKNQYGKAFLVRPEEDNPRSSKQKGLQSLRNLQRVLQGLGEGAPSRGITNLGLEREIQSLSMDKARRWLGVGVSMDRHKSSEVCKY